MERKMKAVLDLARKHLSTGHTSTILEHMGGLFLLRIVGSKSFEAYRRSMMNDAAREITTRKSIVQWITRPRSELCHNVGIYSDLIDRARMASPQRAAAIMEYFDSRSSASRANKDLAEITAGICAVLTRLHSQDRPEKEERVKVPPNEQSLTRTQTPPKKDTSAAMSPRISSTDTGSPAPQRLIAFGTTRGKGLRKHRAKTPMEKENVTPDVHKDGHAEPGRMCASVEALEEEVRLKTATLEEKNEELQSAVLSLKMEKSDMEKRVMGFEKTLHYLSAEKVKDEARIRELKATIVTLRMEKSERHKKLDSCLLRQLTNDTAEGGGSSDKVCMDAMSNTTTEDAFSPSPSPRLTSTSYNFPASPASAKQHPALAAGPCTPRILRISETERLMLGAPQGELYAVQNTKSSDIPPSTNIVEDLHLIVEEAKMMSEPSQPRAWGVVYEVVNTLRALIIHHDVGTLGFLDCALELIVGATTSRESSLARNGLNSTMDLWRHAGCSLTSSSHVKPVLAATFSHYRSSKSFMVSGADQAMATAIEHGPRELIMFELLEMISDQHRVVSEKASIFVDSCLRIMGVGQGEMAGTGLKEGLDSRKLITTLHEGMGGITANGRLACKKAMFSVAAALGSEAFDEALDAWLSPAQGRSVKQELEKLARKPGSSYSKSGAVGGSRQRWSMRTASGDNNQPPWRAVPARAGMN